MSTDEVKKCAVVKCPPIPSASPDYVGKTIAQLRKDSELRKKTEMDGDEPVAVSKDGGKTFVPISAEEEEKYVVESGDVVEFGRKFSRKGL